MQAADAHVETEVKFLVEYLPEVQRRLVALGAERIGDRAHESNIRFDTTDGRLRREHRALRLRRDARVTVAYKGPGHFEDGIRSRPELELEVGDFAAAQDLLHALGFVVAFRYEKYRSTYRVGNVQVMLDELPYGNFVELEGGRADIKKLAGRLGLRWEAAIPESYLGLFERLKALLQLPFDDLTFENFSGRRITPADLGAVPADG